MSTPTTTIQLRIDHRTKSKAQAVLKKLGTDLSSVVKIFLQGVIKTKSIPPVVLTANGYTPEYEKEILDELKAMKNGHETTYKNAKEFLADLKTR